MMSCLEMVKMQLGRFWGLSEFDDDFDLLVSQAGQNVLRILEKSTVHFEGKGTLKTSVYPLNSIEYMLFLYEAARINLRRGGVQEVSDALYYLNKMMNGADIYYEVNLPQFWIADHPLGAVMGRAEYSPYFYFHQGCTVGKNKSSAGPKIGEACTMMAGSCVFGASEIGSNCIIAAGTVIKDEIIPDNSIVFGHSPDLAVKRNRRNNLKDWWR